MADSVADDPPPPSPAFSPKSSSYSFKEFRPITKCNPRESLILDDAWDFSRLIAFLLSLPRRT